MEKPATVVIADQSVQLCRELRTALEETGVFEVVAITNEGGKAIELVNRFSPDIFIIDLMIPLVECMPDLREIIPQKSRLCVVAITFFATEYTEYALIEMGVCHLLLKPFDIHSAGPYIEQVWREYSRKIRSVTCHSAHMLCALGIPTNILGYPYLQKAIELAIKDPTATANITRDIYVPIASFLNTTPEQVRFEISRSVQDAWEFGDREQMQLFLGHGTVKAGANEKFIAAIADRIRLGLTE